MKEAGACGPHLPALVEEAWPDAVEDAVDETGIEAGPAERRQLTGRGDFFRIFL